MPRKGCSGVILHGGSSSVQLRVRVEVSQLFTLRIFLKRTKTRQDINAGRGRHVTAAKEICKTLPPPYTLIICEWAVPKMSDWSLAGAKHQINLALTSHRSDIRAQVQAFEEGLTAIQRIKASLSSNCEQPETWLFIYYMTTTRKMQKNTSCFLELFLVLIKQTQQQCKMLRNFQQNLWNHVL